MELLADCLFKDAFQAETRDNFRERMQKAVVACDELSRLHEKVEPSASKRWVARGIYAKFWIANSPPERRDLITQCLTLAEEAAILSEQEGSLKELASSHRDLLTYLMEAAPLTVERAQLRERLERILALEEPLLSEYESLGDDQGLLEALHLTLLLPGYSWLALEPRRVEGLVERAAKRVDRILQLARKLDTPEAICLANEAVGWAHERESEEKYVKALSFLEAAMPAAEVVRDSYLSGRILAYSAYLANVIGLNEEDVESRRSFFEKGLEYAVRAAKLLEVPLHGDRLDTAYWWAAECRVELANLVETEAEKKKTQLREAIQLARKGIPYKDYTWAAASSYTLGKALYFQALTESSREESARLLREALSIREETVRRYEAVDPISWGAGSEYNYLALIKAELAKIEEKQEAKLSLLQGAVSDMRRCVELCTKSIPNPSFIRVLARYVEWYGDIAAQLYDMSKVNEAAQEALRAYAETISYLEKSGKHGAIPLVKWKIAKIHDQLGDFQSAATSFKQAAEDYAQAAEKIPSLRVTLLDVASYMAAWNQIEEARLRHHDEQYTEASEAYSAAATSLQSTKSWTYLAKHYLSCSLIEKGESLSREERSEDSVEAFNQAVLSFKETEQELENLLTATVGATEEAELRNWLSITRARESYSQGRISFEEAKVFDKKGDELGSLKKYGAAAQIFKALLEHIPVDQNRGELETLVLFCEALAEMKQAETEASAEHYAHAAETFLKAKESAASAKFRLLALANASICEALELGMTFRRSRDIQLYSEIKKHLEAAADYYNQSGFQSASSWARATQKLFDALLYSVKAETESETKAKREAYHFAEGHFELAGRLYGEAGFTQKREEVQRQIQRIHEEKELLLTPVEALSESPAIAQASATPISLTRDHALGLERFEAANIVGTIVVEERDLLVGHDLTYELEISNVGKTTATLLKLENFVPEGFDLAGDDLPYRVRGHHMDFRGKRLEYLHTDEVKIPLKAARKGESELRPKLLFADERGGHRSFLFETVPLKVRELGISGWIKGTRGRK